MHRAPFMSAPVRTLIKFLLLAVLIASGATNAAPSAAPAPEYEHDIRPLMERRCLVCHGCYDAPCQLKLDSYQGVVRGASKTRVYESARLVPAAPSRLFEDAQTTAAWRAR